MKRESKQVKFQVSFLKGKICTVLCSSCQCPLGDNMTYHNLCWLSQWLGTMFFRGMRTFTPFCLSSSFSFPIWVLWKVSSEHESSLCSEFSSYVNFLWPVFSNLNISVILCWCFRGLKSSKKEQNKWKNNSYKRLIAVRFDLQKEVLKKLSLKYMCSAKTSTIFHWEILSGSNWGIAPAM